MSIPDEPLKARAETLKSLGNPVVLESYPDAWYYGGTEIVVMPAPDGLELWITDFEEGSEVKIMVSREQFVKMALTLVGAK
jgi:hypothetical protein